MQEKIKNGDASGWTSLLSYARTAPTVLNQTENVNDRTLIGYDSNTGILNRNSLKDGSYYFVYMKTDDENGKYVSNEAVTFGLSNVIDRTYSIIYYDSGSFNWSDFGDGDTEQPSNNNSGSQNNGTSTKNEDGTTSKISLPHAGLNIAVITIIVIILIGVGIISYKKSKKYKGI